MGGHDDGVGQSWRPGAKLVNKSLLLLILAVLILILLRPLGVGVAVRRRQHALLVAPVLPRLDLIIIRP